MRDADLKSCVEGFFCCCFFVFVLSEQERIYNNCIGVDAGLLFMLQLFLTMWSAFPFF